MIKNDLNNTYGSFCDISNVMLSVVVSPYFKYPKSPTDAYKIVMSTMATFSTPSGLVKSLGSLITFCSGKIYE